jgi:Capsular polysaccharide synthesis protein
MHSFPKTIWMLWLQGWERAPLLVQACRRSWEVNNPGWTIHCLDQRTVADFIGNFEARGALDDPDQPPEACSDRVRVALLAQHGGIWADATTYCLRPLNDWLLDVLGSGFFAFDRPGPDRLLSSWFLAARPGNYIVQRWAERTLEYWQGRKFRHHYFWFHHIFGDEYEKNSDFRLIWDNTPKISAAGPHYYLPQDLTLWAPLTECDKQQVTGVDTPLLKLSHHLPQGEYPIGSVAEYLCKRLGF